MLLYYEHRPRRIGKIRQHMSSEVSRNRCVQISEIAKALVYFFLLAAFSAATLAATKRGPTWRLFIRANRIAL